MIINPHSCCIVKHCTACCSIITASEYNRNSFLLLFWLPPPINIMLASGHRATVVCCWARSLLGLQFKWHCALSYHSTVTPLIIVQFRHNDIDECLLRQQRRVSQSHTPIDPNGNHTINWKCSSTISTANAHGIVSSALHLLPCHAFARKPHREPSVTFYAKKRI